MTGGTLYQCRECRFIWDPSLGRALRCGRCDAEQYYEALDTWCFGGDEVSAQRLRNVVSNLAIAAGLCRAWTLGASSEWFDVERLTAWRPGCGKAAP